MTFNDTCDTRPLILVLGCGISGLSCATRLLELHGAARLRVRILAAEADAYRTTSYGCGGLWMPFHIEPVDQVRVWARQTYERLLREAAAEDGGGLDASGVGLFYGGKLLTAAPAADDDLPYWRDDVRDFCVITRAEWQTHRQHVDGANRAMRCACRRPAAQLEALHFPDGYTHAISWLTAVVNMPVYISRLVERFKALGGEFAAPSPSDGEGAASPTTSAHFHSFEKVLTQCAGQEPLDRVLLIHATGLGARELCHDHQVRPARGILLRVRRPVHCFLQAEGGPLGTATHPTYIIPRNGQMSSCGGTVLLDDDAAAYRHGGAGNGEPLSDTDRAIRDDIHRRCALLLPSVFAHTTPSDIAEVWWDGLRPVRDGGVRLEWERRPWSAEEGRGAGATVHVVHNYGHGGGGVTVSWGCANACAELVRQALKLG